MALVVISGLLMKNSLFLSIRVVNSNIQSLYFRIYLEIKRDFKLMDPIRLWSGGNKFQEVHSQEYYIYQVSQKKLIKSEKINNLIENKKQCQKCHVTSLKYEISLPKMSNIMIIALFECHGQVA